MPKSKIQPQTSKQNQEALDELRRLGAVNAPGATALGSGRLNGRFATATWGTMTLLLFEWDIVYEQEFVDGTAHGEYWDNPVPIKQMWTGTARMYHTTILPGADAGTAGWNTFMAANNAIYNAGKVSGDPAVATFRGYNQPTAQTDRYIFGGDCYVSRANFSAPRSGMVTQEVTLRGKGAPAFGPLA